MSDGVAVDLEDKRLAVTSRCAKPAPAPFNSRAVGAETLGEHPFDCRLILGTSGTHDELVGSRRIRAHVHIRSAHEASR